MDYSPWGHKESGTTEWLTPRPRPLWPHVAGPCSPAGPACLWSRVLHGRTFTQGPQDWNLVQLMMETQAWPGLGVAGVRVAPAVQIVSYVGTSLRGVFAPQWSSPTTAGPSVGGIFIRWGWRKRAGDRSLEPRKCLFSDPQDWSPSGPLCCFLAARPGYSLLLDEFNFPTQTTRWLWAPVLALLGVVYIIT